MDATPKTNARKLKPFGPELRDGMVYDRTVTELTGARPHIRQFQILTMAPTKDAAVAQFAATVMKHSGNKNRLRVQMGNAVDNLIAAGVLTGDGAIIVFERYVPGTQIVRVLPGSESEVIAHFAANPTGTYGNRTIVVMGPPPESGE